MTDLTAVWPQNRVDLDCFVTISMDVAAPFLSDMGLPGAGMEPLRAALREKIDERPEAIARGGASGIEEILWFEQLGGLLRNRVPAAVRRQFYDWIRNTYTSVPADRPNWERYEVFFFQWSVGMRTGEDNAGCFAEPVRVYEAYYAFVRSRALQQRIQEASQRNPSPWDEKMFSLRRYSLDEDEVDSGAFFDPFGVVYPTGGRNYFQQFWEYLLPRLSADERKLLYDATRGYYRRMSSVAEVLPPERLTRTTR